MARLGRQAVRFEETQRFRQLWLVIPLGALAIGMLGLSVQAAWVQLWHGQPWGSKPMSDGGLVAMVAFMMLTGVGVPLLFLFMRLHVTVDGSELVLRFMPFWTRRVRLSDIRTAEAVSYRPIRDFGGWGIRWGGPSKGWVFSVSGDRGVSLELAGGKRLMVGSQHAEELAAALSRR